MFPPCVNKCSKRGFTLIELLVVIAIIGLLSSVILASLNSARQKAQYAAVASELQEAYKAFYLLNIDRGCWPREGSTACGGYSGSNPYVSTLISSSAFGLSKYLSAAPSWPFSTAKWHYDNDGDTLPATCTGPDNRGVNLYIDGVTLEQYEALEKILDGDDPDTSTAKYCGKLIYSATSEEIFFRLSPDQ